MKYTLALLFLIPALVFGAIPHQNRGVNERDIGGALNVYIHKRECLQRAGYNASKRKACLNEFQKNKQKLYDHSQKALTKPSSKRKTPSKLIQRNRYAR